MSPKSTELPVVDMVMNDIALTKFEPGDGLFHPAIIPLVVELTVDNP